MAVIVITGATNGIGLATAKYLLEKGHTVYGIARHAYEGNDFVCYQADVNDSTAVSAIFEEIYHIEGHIDVLVNNAGFGIAGAIADASKEKMNAITQTNLVALADLCGKIIPYMRKNEIGTKNKSVKKQSPVNRGRRGTIVNISSVGGIMPLPYQAMYSATKAGVEVFSRALDNEVNDQKIRVCAVLPNDTKTGFTEARVVEANESAPNAERMRHSILKMEHDEQNGMPPLAVAKVVYKAISKRHPPLRMSVGFLSKLEVFLTRLLPVAVINKILKKMYG
jgi:short-subunit dehydrogenase